MPKVVVVIPVYKSHPSPNEVLSFVRCLRVLNNYHITLFTFKGLDTSFYLKIANERNKEISFVYFSESFFAGTQGYNELLISLEFYQPFKSWDFMLIYQLDAWVFRDELEYWCNKGYDYIGAPWFENWHNANKSSKVVGIGNGGFSLRNVPKALTVLRRVQRIKQLRKFWFKSKLQSIFRFKNLLKKFTFIHSQCDFVYLPEMLGDHYQYNEDLFWGIIVSSVFNDFRLGDINEATRFSFEVNPSFLFAQNESKLPFGCHAWEKYEPEFWNKYIQVNG